MISLAPIAPIRLASDGVCWCEDQLLHRWPAPRYAIGDLGDAVKGQAGLVRADAGRRMTGTGLCIALIAAGAILRFAVGAGSRHGLDVHAVGVIVIGAGELGLLSLLVWGPLNPAWRHRDGT